MSAYNKLETLSRRLRMLLDDSSESLAKARAKINGCSDGEVENCLSWNAEDMAKTSIKHALMDRVAAMMSNQVHSAMLDAGCEQLSDEQENEIARKVQAICASECISIILRGAESSTSRISNVNSIARIEAAKEVMEKIAGMDSYIFDSELFYNVIVARDAQEVVRQEQFDAEPAKLCVAKESGCYVFRLFDRKDRLIKQAGDQSITRKEQAKELAVQIANDNKPQYRSITIEYAA